MIERPQGRVLLTVGELRHEYLQQGTVVTHRHCESSHAHVVEGLASGL
jgi:hypothetical protein